MPVDLMGMTDPDLGALYRDVRVELERRETLASAKARMEELAREYETAVEGEPARTWAPGTVVGPGQKVVEGGKEYVNTSGAWLSASPSQYPLGYRLSTPPPASQAPAWNPNGHPYKAGDQVSYKGTVYKVIQAHTSQAGWTPDAVLALYSPA